MSVVLIGLDDTDAPGARASTARLARMLGEVFAPRLAFVGSIGHRLCAEVAATTNNKASCVILRAETADPGAILEQAKAFLAREATPSAPFGVAVAAQHEIGDALKNFGRRASAEPVSRDDARAVLQNFAHFGAGDGRGLIGAAAALGLTAAGWSGRWLEREGGLRAVERALTVAELTAAGIVTLSLETDAEVPKPEDYVDTHGWLRPQLLGGRAVLPLRRVTEGGWEIAAAKTPKDAFASQDRQAGVTSSAFSDIEPPPRTKGSGKGTGSGTGNGTGHGSGRGRPD